MELTNFFGNPDEFKTRIAEMDAETFKTFMKKKEEQWEILQRNHSAYMFFMEDSHNACNRDAECMRYLREEKAKRGL